MPMKIAFQSQSAPKQQQGAVLLIGLITILILTIIGLYASRSSTMGIMMATNSQHVAVALAAAENSVTAGEKRIVTEFGGPPTFDLNENQSDGYYYEGEIDLNELDWDAQGGIERNYDNAGNLISEFIIEYIPPAGGSGGGGSAGTGTGGTASGTYLYRVTGRGQSPRGGARLVQTIFAAT